MPTESKGRTPLYRDWTLLQMAALVLALDQLTKFVVRQTLEWHYSWPYHGFFRFTHVQNTGSAFGLFQGYNLPLLFVSLVGVVVLAYIYRSQEQPSLLMRISIALMLGGAVGNLLDRILQGHVTDFIDIGPWPVFNLARLRHRGGPVHHGLGAGDAPGVAGCRGAGHCSPAVNLPHLRRPHDRPAQRSSLRPIAESGSGP